MWQNSRAVFRPELYKYLKTQSSTSLQLFEADEKEANIGEDVSGRITCVSALVLRVCICAWLRVRERGEAGEHACVYVCGPSP